MQPFRWMVSPNDEFVACPKCGEKDANPHFNRIRVSEMPEMPEEKS
jgi:hypothetical protein